MSLGVGAGKFWYFYPRSKINTAKQALLNFNFATSHKVQLDGTGGVTLWRRKHFDDFNVRKLEHFTELQTQTAEPEEDHSTEVQQSAEDGVKERVQKKRKEKPSDKDGTSKYSMHWTCTN